MAELKSNTEKSVLETFVLLVAWLGSKFVFCSITNHPEMLEWHKTTIIHECSHTYWFTGSADLGQDQLTQAEPTNAVRASRLTRVS